MSSKHDERVVIARDLDVLAFKDFLSEQWERPPSDEVALISLHKLRIHYAKQGPIPQDLAEQSQRWLEDNGFTIDIEG